MTGEEDPLGRQKDAAEPRWRAALVGFWQGQLERVKKKLVPGIPKSRKAVEDLPKRLDKSFWDKENEELMSVLLPLLNQAAQEAGQVSAEAIGDEFGLSIDWTLVNTDAVAWARKYGYGLVRGINDTTKKQLQQAVSLWVETPGATMGELYDELAGLPSFNDHRAKLVAVTEVTRSYAEGSLASARAYETEGLFLWRKKWQTNNDALVCTAICLPLHDETVMGTDGVFSNGSVAPPAHPGCILPGNEIVTLGPVSAACKSFYVGRCVEITLGNGSSLTVTENHPILTPSGWVAAQSLSKGDNVVCTSGAERIAAGIEPDYDHRPVIVEKIFDSLVESGSVSTCRVPTTAEDFYGDGRAIHGNVDVVYPYGFLLGNIKARLAKLVREVRFNGHDAGTSLFNGKGAFTTFIPGGFATFGSAVGRRSLGGPLFERHALPLDKLSSGLTTGLDTGFKETLAKRPAIDTRFAGELILRFPGEVALQQIAKVRNFDFRGHVYDLQCDLYELYTCNGAFVKNCRCWTTLRPVLEEVEPGVRAGRPTSMGQEQHLEKELAEAQQYVEEMLALGDREAADGMRSYLDALKENLKQERTINTELWNQFGLRPDKATDDHWRQLANGLQKEGYDLYKKYTREGIKMTVMERRAAKDSGYMTVGSEHILVKKGRFSRAKARQIEGQMWGRAKDELSGAMGQLLQRAGYTASDIKNANYEQRRRLLEEIGQKAVMKTASGRVSKIDDVPEDSRVEWVERVDYDLAATCAQVAIDPLSSTPTLDAYGKMDLAEQIRATRLGPETLKDEEPAPLWF